MSKIVKPLTLAIGAAFIGSLSLAQVARADTGFHMSPMNSGYQLGDKAPEGKCGEGKCGATKGKKCMEMSDKAAQDKCMTEAHPKGKDGDKKGKEGSCSADKKGKEGSCSADKKGKEGSCSSH
jgi:uncharacterized low-complexity protein